MGDEKGSRGQICGFSHFTESGETSKGVPYTTPLTLHPGRRYAKLFYNVREV